MKRTGYAKNPSRIMTWNNFSRHSAALSTKKKIILYGSVTFYSNVLTSGSSQGQFCHRAGSALH
eukprot:13856556-Ditylum_brightwellii.AAC.1